MIYCYRGMYIAAVYLAGSAKPIQDLKSHSPLHTWYFLPLKLSNKLNLPLSRLEDYRILPYSLVNNSESARVKQHQRRSLFRIMRHIGTFTHLESAQAG